MFAFHDTRGPVAAAFTDRHGGVSQGPFASLNLAESGGDDPAAVAENLRRAVAELTHGSAGAGTGPAVVRMRQVHGSAVATVGGSDDGVAPEADGLVTAEAGVVLVVRVADCVPVLLADERAGVVGAAHAGRVGLVAGVVGATVDAMRACGARDVVAWVGPHVCGGCYEVPAELRDEVVAAVPAAKAETRWGTPAVDVGAGVRAQLAEAGVDVVAAGGCTLEDERFFSYRRQGAASGRSAGLVWVRP